MHIKIRERKDITLSQNQSKGIRNEETQHHQNVDNIPIIKTENELIEFRQKQQ